MKNPLNIGFEIGPGVQQEAKYIGNRVAVFIGDHKATCIEIEEHEDLGTTVATFETDYKTDPDVDLVVQSLDDDQAEQAFSTRAKSEESEE